MTVVEKAAYLKGLVEGLGIEADSKEGKLWGALNDLLHDMAHEIEDLHACNMDHAEALDEIAEELTYLEELRTKDMSTPKQDVRKAFDFDEHPSAPSHEERADALIEEIGQNIETALKSDEQLPQNVKRFDHLEFTANFNPNN